MAPHLRRGLSSKSDTMRWQFRLPAYSCDFEISFWSTMVFQANNTIKGAWLNMEKLYTRKEAAEILGISISTLDAARSNGLIAYVQYVQNGCVFFTNAGLQEYIAKCTHRAKPVENKATYRTPRPSKR